MIAGRRAIGLDIISEILETDRLAEEKLEAAMEKRGEMELSCDFEVGEIRMRAEAEAEEYRRKKLEECGAANNAGALKESEQAQLKALSEAFEKNHEKWENDIVAAITGQG